jgi:transaldolase
MGADVCTMPFAVINKLYNHPLTDVGLKNFLSDWKKLTEKEESLQTAGSK